MYMASIFSMVSKLREYNGESGLLEGFCEEQGIEPPKRYTMYKDAKGKSYAIDSNGKSMPLHKAKPKWLKVVK